MGGIQRTIFKQLGTLPSRNLHGSCRRWFSSFRRAQGFWARTASRVRWWGGILELFRPWRGVPGLRGTLRAKRAMGVGDTLGGLGGRVCGCSQSLSLEFGYSLKQREVLLRARVAALKCPEQLKEGERDE